MQPLLQDLKGFPQLKRILVVGNGGRENALGWALTRSRNIEKVFVAPGNGGTEIGLGCLQLEIEATNPEKLIEACKKNQIDLVVIGPEAPLAEGLADKLRAAELPVFGPNANGAQLEASKEWAKNLMSEAGIPTANHWHANTEEEAISILNKLQRPLVVKADGLAAGKGVTVSESIEETKRAIKDLFQGKYGSAGSKIILEEKIQGPEVSIFALSDGKNFILLPSAQDHKRLKEGDKGPNTGGMGAYAPAALIDTNKLKEIEAAIIKPTLKALNRKGVDYRGVIYVGLMLTSSGPKVIEYNCRFGDPECQTLMPLIGEEFAEVLYACALGALEKAPSLSTKNICSACVVAAASGYPESPRQNDPITTETSFEENMQIFYAGAQKNTNGELLTSGGRVLSITAQGKNFDEAFKNAYKGLSKIHFEGITYRRDIGYQVRKFSKQDSSN